MCDSKEGMSKFSTVNCVDVINVPTIVVRYKAVVCNIMEQCVIDVQLLNGSLLWLWSWLSLHWVQLVGLEYTFTGDRMQTVFKIFC